MIIVNNTNIHLKSLIIKNNNRLTHKKGNLYEKGIIKHKLFGTYFLPLLLLAVS